MTENNYHKHYTAFCQQTEHLVNSKPWHKKLPNKYQKKLYMIKVYTIMIHRTGIMVQIYLVLFKLQQYLAFTV